MRNRKPAGKHSSTTNNAPAEPPKGATEGKNPHMTRYQRFYFIVQATLPAALPGNFGVIATALDTILQGGDDSPDGPTLAERIDQSEKPVGEMVSEYCHFIRTASQKPDWLENPPAPAPDQQNTE